MAEPSSNTRAASTRSTLGIFATKLAMFPLSFIVSIFVAVDLEAGGFGTYQYLVLLVGPVLHILSFGLGGGITYIVGSKQFDASTLLTTCGAIGLLIGGLDVILVGGLWSVGLLGVIGKSVTFDLLWPVLVAMVLQGMLQMFYRLAMGASWFGVMNTLDLVKAVSMPVLLFLMVVVLGLGLQGTVYAILVNAIVLWVLVLVLVSRKGTWRTMPKRKAVREASRYGVKAWVGDAGAQAYNRLDHLIFGFVSTEELFGFYSLAARITEILWVPTYALGPVLFNRVAAAKEKAERLYLTALNHRLAFYGILLGGIVLAANLGWFIPVVYQHKFDASILPALILIPGTILMVTQKVLTKYFSGSGRPEISSLITVFGALTLGGLALVLITPFGPSGAALASTLSYTLMAVVSLVLYRRMIAPAPLRLFTLNKGDLAWLRIRLNDALGVWQERVTGSSTTKRDDRVG